MAGMMDKGMMGKGGMDKGMMDKGGMDQENPTEEAAPQEEMDKGGDGAVQDISGAIQTLATFVMAQKEKGSPQADAMVEAFKNLLGAMKTEGGSEVPEESPPEEAPPEAPAPRMGGGGQIPMNSKKGAVPIM